MPAGAAADGPVAGDAFVILESQADPAAYQLVSPDIATCDDCRRELLDPARPAPRLPLHQLHQLRAAVHDHRGAALRPRAHDHAPLPPLSRVPARVRGPGRPALPRRAQRVPGLRAAGTAAAAGGARAGAPARWWSWPPAPKATRRAPIRAAAELLRAGEILAVKGLGGFHLACDATDGDAVRRLKLRKRRPDKPLAVMFSGLDELRRHCRVSPAEEALLTSPEHPVVLLEWREIGPDGEPGPELGAGGRPQHDAFADEEAPVDTEVAVRQRYLGAMLPYTPLHILLLRAAGRPLVMTSGNLAEEPIVKGWEEIDRLTPVADAYLVHDREIAVRYDDSVAQVRAGRPRLIRRSRGYAPFPVALPRPLPQTLAAGAELKNTFCLTRDANAFLSQHIGDLENLETLEHYEASVEVYRQAVPPRPGGRRLRPASGVPGDQVRAGAAAAGEGGRAAPPRAHRGAAGRARPGGGRHRREPGRPRLRRRRSPVGRRGAGVRPPGVPQGRAPGGAAAARRRRGDHASLAHGPRLELRAPRRGGPRARDPPARAAAATGRTRRSEPPSCGRSSAASTSR